MKFVCLLSILSWVRSRTWRPELLSNTSRAQSRQLLVGIIFTCELWCCVTVLRPREPCDCCWHWGGGCSTQGEIATTLVFLFWFRVSHPTPCCGAHTCVSCSGVTGLRWAGSLLQVENQLSRQALSMIGSLVLSVRVLLLETSRHRCKQILLLFFPSPTANLNCSQVVWLYKCMMRGRKFLFESAGLTNFNTQNLLCGVDVILVLIWRDRSACRNSLCVQLCVTSLCIKSTEVCLVLCLSSKEAAWTITSAISVALFGPPPVFACVCSQRFDVEPLSCGHLGGQTCSTLADVSHAGQESIVALHPNGLDLPFPAVVHSRQGALHVPLQPDLLRDGIRTLLLLFPHTLRSHELRPLLREPAVQVEEEWFGALGSAGREPAN